MKTYYREADGHTYFIDASGELMGAPTYADGSVAFAAAGHVDDFVHPPSAPERARILQYLQGEATFSR